MTVLDDGSASGPSEIHNSHNHSASWHGGSVWNHGQVRGGRRSLIIKSHWPDIAYICNTLCILSSLVCFPRYDKSADSAYTPNRIKNDDLTAILNQYPSLWNVNILPISLPNILPSDYWHSRHVVCGLWFPDDLPPEVRLQRHQLHHHHHSHRHWVRHPPNRLYQAWARGVRHWD